MISLCAFTKIPVNDMVLIEPTHHASGANMFSLFCQDVLNQRVFAHHIFGVGGKGGIVLHRDLAPSNKGKVYKWQCLQAAFSTRLNNSKA